MKFLFLKRSLSWPHATGHDVHTYHMAKALAELGHSIELATVIPPAPSAVAGLPLDNVFSLASGGRQPPVAAFDHSFVQQQGADAPRSPSLSWLQHRYLRYWGIDSKWIDATATIVSATRPEVVVAASLDVLPCLAAVKDATRIWYAADEYATHHLSMLKLWRPRTWRHGFEAAIAGVYERAYAPHIDRVWVVSSKEQRAMRRVSGVRAVDVVPNGVDGEFFRPETEPQVPRSCAFWGRLDAGPNIQAVVWFAHEVWPAVRQTYPDARFTAFGFRPAADIQALHGQNGISVVADLPDLRPALWQHQVAVMPFVSGGGIKNKVLEAAALGIPVVCTALACGGLRGDESIPLTVVRSPAEWVSALGNLWGDESARQQISAKIREWVLEYHSWSAAAQAAFAPLAVRSETRNPEFETTP